MQGTPQGYRIPRLRRTTCPCGSPESVLGSKDGLPGPPRLDERADSDPGTISASRVLGGVRGQPEGKPRTVGGQLPPGLSRVSIRLKASTLSQLPGHLPQRPRRGSAKAPSLPRLNFASGATQHSAGLLPHPFLRGAGSSDRKMAAGAGPDGHSRGALD